MEQDFEVMVSFQYTKLEQDDLDGGSDASETGWWTIDEDIFYPFSTKSYAEGLQTVAVMTATALVTLIM